MSSRFTTFFDNQGLLRNRRHRFVQLATDMGVLTSDARRLALQRIRAKQIGEGTGTRVGEWLVQQRLLPHEARQRVLDEQARLRRAVNLRNPTVASRYRDQTAEGIVALIAILSACVLNRYYEWDLDVAVGVPGFAAWAVLAVWQMRSRSWTQTLVRAIKYAVLIAAPICAMLPTNSVLLLRQLATGGGRVDGQAFEWHVVQILAAIGAQTFLILGTASFATLKFLEVRYSEGRIGAMRDTLQKIETVFLGAQRGRSLDVRQQAVQVVVNGLRASASLAPGSMVYQMLRYWWRPSFAQHTAFVLVPTSDGRFDIAAISYSPNATVEVIATFDRMLWEYHPFQVDADEFARLRQLAMGESGSDWKQVFHKLCVKARGRAVSACGWAFRHRTTLFSVDASRCLAYDGSYLAHLREADVPQAVLDWFEVGSFVASPVLDIHGNAVAVLMITSTTTRGFRPQDIELVTAAASMLTSIWHRT